jgi:hypothetical protein
MLARWSLPRRFNVYRRYNNAENIPEQHGGSLISPCVDYLLSRTSSQTTTIREIPNPAINANRTKTSLERSQAKLVSIPNHSPIVIVCTESE